MRSDDELVNRLRAVVGEAHVQERAFVKGMVAGAGEARALVAPGSIQQALDALQAWKQQWDAAAAAAKARDWTETIILLEKCVLMRPDFAKGYMTLSRVYGQAAGGDPYRTRHAEDADAAATRLPSIMT